MFTHLQRRNRRALLGKMNSIYPSTLPHLYTPLLVKCSPISYAFLMAVLHVIRHDLTPLAILRKVYKL